METKETGRVKFYNKEKGLGFIICERTGEDLHVFKDDLIDEIKEDDRVTFTIEEKKVGPSAIKVKKM